MLFLPVGSTEPCGERRCQDPPVLSRETPGSQGWPRKEPASSKGPGYPTAGTFLPEHCCLTCDTVPSQTRPGPACSRELSHLQNAAQIPIFHTFLLPATQSQPFWHDPRAPWLYCGQNRFSFNIQTQTPGRAQQLQAPVLTTGEVGSVQDTGKGMPGHQRLM